MLFSVSVVRHGKPRSALSCQDLLYLVRWMGCFEQPMFQIISLSVHGRQWMSPFPSEIIVSLYMSKAKPFPFEYILYIQIKQSGKLFHVSIFLSVEGN